MDQPPPSKAPPRSVLPSAPEPFGGVIGNTYKSSTPDWPKPVRAPSGAPHIVVIMMDDLGFGQLSSYGGPIETPSISALARGGVRYTNFHTTALCSPTRAALLTGRNHHSVGFASIAELARGFPGHNAYMPKSAATIAEVLRQNGYSTYITGKWHLTPSADATAAGPFDRWPLGLGFDRFYGFLPGETDHWHPMLVADNHRIPTPEREDYHLSEDIVSQAIAMLRDQRQVATGRPVFLYVPFGAPHCPFHAPSAYIDHYKGRFDAGWDALREETFLRQKELGIIPQECDLPQRDPGIKQWSALSADERRLFARLMETFAGMVDHADAQIGRLMQALRDLDMFDDTLVLFLSDNGASQEGLQNGTINTERFRNLLPMSVQEMLPFLDQIGGPATDPHYPMGWAMAGNTPFRRYKRDTHRGGNTDPLIAHWPSRIKDGGRIRTQYCHVTDIHPTLLEVAGLPVPQSVNGVDQIPLEGHSIAKTFADDDAAQVRTSQYYEMRGSRAMWHEGWMAVTWHKPNTDWDDDSWELYHQDRDFSQAHDLAAEQPEKLKALIAQWWEEAYKHNVLPLDDRGQGFLDPGRPRASIPQDIYRYYAATSPIPNQSLPSFYFRAYRFTARFILHDAQDEGVLVAQGGNLGGWVLFVRDRGVSYVNNYLRISSTVLSTGPALPVGREVSVSFDWHPLERGIGRVTIAIDGRLAAEAPRVQTAPRGYSAVQEGLQIGRCWAASMAPNNFDGPFAFTGDLRVVELWIQRDTKQEPDGEQKG